MRAEEPVGNAQELLQPSVLHAISGRLSIPQESVCAARVFTWLLMLLTVRFATQAVEPVLELELRVVPHAFSLLSYQVHVLASVLSVTMQVAAEHARSVVPGVGRVTTDRVVPYALQEPYSQTLLASAVPKLHQALTVPRVAMSHAKRASAPQPLNAKAAINRRNLLAAFPPRVLARAATLPVLRQTTAWPANILVRNAPVHLQTIAFHV